MAGTLTLSTLSDGTNSTSATNPIRGSARAWVNFNGTGTVAILGSFNVSSITRDGTGLYTLNFTTAMPNANFAVLCDALSLVFDQVCAYENLQTTSVRIKAQDGSGIFIDISSISTAIFSS
jgi:hypothetical protein